MEVLLDENSRFPFQGHLDFTAQSFPGALILPDDPQHFIADCLAPVSFTAAKVEEDEGDSYSSGTIINKKQRYFLEQLASTFTRLLG